MEIYKLWTEFNLRGNAFEKMEKFSTLVKLTSERTDVLQKMLNGLSERLGIVSELSKSLGMNLTEVSTGFSSVTSNGRRSKEALSGFNRVAATSIGRTELLTRNINSLSRSLESVAVAGAISGSSKKGTNKGKGVGILPYVGAIGGISLFRQGFKQQEVFQQQVQQLKNSGLNDAQITQAVSFAEIPQKGISTIGRIQSLNDAFMATKDFGSALKLAPFLAEAEFASNATFKTMSTAQRQFLVKFAEMRAGGDMTKISGAMDLGFKMMNASAGTLDPRQQAQFMKQAASVAYHLSDRGYAALEPVMQEATGTRIGTAYQTGFQMMATGTGTLNNKKRVADLLKLGIYKAAHMDREGRVISTTMDPAMLSLYETDPVGFTKKMIDIYKQDGTVSSGDINKRFALDFPRTTAQMMSLIMKNMSKIDRQLALFDKQQGINDSFIQSMNIPTGASERLENSWSSLMTSFGKITSPLVISGMTALTSFLEKIANILSTSNLQKIADKLNNVEKNIGGRIEKAEGYFGIKNPTAISSATKPTDHMVVHTQINMDGKKVASAVSRHQSTMMSFGGVINGTAGTNAGLTPVSINYNQASLA